MRNINVRKLTVLFILAAAVYALAARLLRQAPNIVIDESLYTNLARSILYEGRAAYRAQPVEYPYLLYPLLLVPVYFLQSLLGGDVYRWVQVFNALLITSSVFPVWLLAKDCARDEKKALTAAVFTVLMPDMLMCAYEMTEALVWPLSLWTVWFGWKLVSGKNGKYGLLTGLFAGLLYATKPGAIAMGAGILLTLLFLRLKKKEPVADLLAGIGAALFVIVFVHAAYRFLFGYAFSPLGLYTKQTSDWQPSHILAVLLGFPALILGFACIGGGVFVLSPYLMRDRLGEERRRFLLAVTVGLLAAMLGTAIMVIPYGWSGKLVDIGLQMRYLAMYLPVFIVLSLSPEEKKGPFAPPYKKVLLIYAALALALGFKRALYPADGSTVDSLSLGAFIHNSQYDGTGSGIICALLLAATGVCAAFAIDPRFPRKGKKLTLALFASLLLLNTLCTAAAVRLPLPKEVAADAAQMNEWLTETDDTPLGVMQARYSDVLTYRLESRLSRPMQQVTSEQMVSSMLSTSGVYAPFVPLNQSPNTNDGLTPETHTLVLGETILRSLEPSPETNVRVTDNGLYALLTIPEGKRWADSMLYGLDDGILTANREGSLFIWATRPEGSVLRLRLNAVNEGTHVKVAAGGEAVNFTVSGTETVEVPLQSSMVTIVSDMDITVLGYSTVS